MFLQGRFTMTTLSSAWASCPLYACLGLVAKNANSALLQTNGLSNDQLRFLLTFPQGIEDLKLLSAGDFQMECSTDNDVLNQWFKQNRFDGIELAPFEEGSIGVAAIVEAGGAWKDLGVETSLRCRDGNNHPGVIMERKQFDAFFSSGHPNPIARIEDRNGFRWHMTCATERITGLDLFELTGRLNNSLTWSKERFTDLEFPMIDQTFLDPHGILEGIVFESEDGTTAPCRIAQSVQEIQIKMNHRGADARSAAGMESRFLGGKGTSLSSNPYRSPFPSLGE